MIHKNTTLCPSGMPSPGACSNTVSDSHPGSQPGCLASQEHQKLREKFTSIEERVIKYLNTNPYEGEFDANYERENAVLYESLRRLECPVFLDIDPRNARQLSCCGKVVGGKYISSPAVERLDRFEYDGRQRKMLKLSTVLCPVCEDEPKGIGLKKRADLNALPDNTPELIERGLRRRLLDPVLQTVGFIGDRIDTSKGIFELIPGDEMTAMSVRQSTVSRPVTELPVTGTDKMDFSSMNIGSDEDSLDEDSPVEGVSDSDSCGDERGSIMGGTAVGSFNVARTHHSESFMQTFIGGALAVTRLFMSGGIFESRTLLTRGSIHSQPQLNNFRVAAPAPKRPKLTPAEFGEARHYELQDRSDRKARLAKIKKARQRNTLH